MLKGIQRKKWKHSYKDWVQTLKRRSFKHKKIDFQLLEFRKLGTYVFPIGSSIIYSIPPQKKKKKLLSHSGSNSEYPENETRRSRTSSLVFPVVACLNYFLLELYLIRPPLPMNQLITRLQPKKCYWDWDSHLGSRKTISFWAPAAKSVLFFWGEFESVFFYEGRER